MTAEKRRKGPEFLTSVCWVGLGFFRSQLGLGHIPGIHEAGSALPTPKDGNCKSLKSQIFEGHERGARARDSESCLGAHFSGANGALS